MQEVLQRYYKDITEYYIFVILNIFIDKTKMLLYNKVVQVKRTKKLIYKK